MKNEVSGGYHYWEKARVTKAGISAVGIGSLLLASCGPAKATETAAPTGDTEPTRTLTVEPPIQVETYAQMPTETATVMPTPEQQIISQEEVEFLASHELNTGDRSRKVVMMTYDDGGDPASIERIMNAVEIYDGKVTFFVTGEWLEKNPDVAREIVARGHLLECHGWDHSEMTALSDAEVRKQIADFLAVSEEILPGYEVKYIRFPFGSRNDRVRKLAAEAGLQSVMWSGESGGVVPDTYSHVVDRVYPGQIVLSHSTRPYDITLVEKIMKTLAEQGYKFETVDEGKAVEGEHITTPHILLLGDSLIALTKIPTMLENELKASGIPAEFVGDKYSFGNTTPADGLGGFNSLLMMRQLTDENITAWTELNGTSVDKHFSEHIPDIVILALGTNDVINLSEGGYDTPENYLEHMTKIIEYLRSKNPNVAVVVPKLILTQDARYNVNIIIFNKVIDELVAGMDTESSRVVTTRDLRNDWTAADFRDDVVHPSTAGQEKMTEAYFDALVDNDLVVAEK